MPIIRDIVFLMGLSILAMGCQSETIENANQVTTPSMQTNEAKPAAEITASKTPSPASVSQQDLETCMDITDGRVLVSELPQATPSRSNYYLECTLNPFIGTVKFTQSERDRVQAAQVKNIAYLSGRDINPQYVTTYGTQLLHAVIVSDLNEDQKMKWVQRLVKDGADINYMNEYGNEALRAAEYKKLPRIYDWLVEKGAKPKRTP